MPIKLTDLFARVPPEVEARVRRARDQARPAVQEALRAECRLVLRTAEETEQKRPGAQVPIEIAPGYPAVLKEIEFPDDIERIMLLGRYRAPLEQTRDAMPGLLQLRDALVRRNEPEPLLAATVPQLQSVAAWTNRLLDILDKHDPLKTVLSVREDFLGVYEYDARGLFIDEHAANRAAIRLYWGVIGLVSEWLGCSVEDLTVVVLTHELAHAYTQLGADIEGRRWAAPSFAKAETELKEGLAQYYTDRVLRRLERRHGGALSVFLKMLPHQPDAYRSHEAWVKDFSPEAVRRAMLEMRRWNEGKLEDFNGRMKAAQSGLSPEAREDS